MDNNSTPLKWSKTAVRVVSTRTAARRAKRIQDLATLKALREKGAFDDNAPSDIKETA